MFDAARAALLHVGAELPKTHSGTATLFSQRLVKTGMVASNLGRDLNRVEELRNIADYMAEPIDAENTKDAISRAETFVRDIETYFGAV